jgi:hypothetical protein
MSVDTIDSACFLRCGRLPTVEFEAGRLLRVLESNAFRSCWSLKSIRIPGSVVALGDLCFRRSGRLRSITCDFPSNRQAIPGESFHRCESLEVVHIPSSLQAEFFGSFGYLKWPRPMADKSAVERFLADNVPLSGGGYQGTRHKIS